MKNVLEHLRHLKFCITSALTKAQAFADIKAKDSLGAEAVLRYMGDTPMAGMPLTIVTPEGELPAPSGDYIAEDGSTIKVTDGVIMEIAPAAAAPATEQNQNPAVATQEQQAPPTQTPPPAMDKNEVTMTPKAIIESIVKESRFKEVVLESVKEALEAKDKTIADQKTAFDEKFTKQEAIIQQLFELVEKIAAEPSATTTAKNKVPFQRHENGLRLPKPSEMQEQIEQYRKDYGL